MILFKYLKKPTLVLRTAVALSEVPISAIVPTSVFPATHFFLKRSFLQGKEHILAFSHLIRLAGSSEKPRNHCF